MKTLITQITLGVFIVLTAMVLSDFSFSINDNQNPQFSLVAGHSYILSDRAYIYKYTKQSKLYLIGEQLLKNRLLSYIDSSRENFSKELKPGFYNDIEILESIPSGTNIHSLIYEKKITSLFRKKNYIYGIVSLNKYKNIKICLDPVFDTIDFNPDTFALTPAEKITPMPILKEVAEKS